LRAEKSTFNVEIQDTVPIVFGHIKRSLGEREAGIVDEYQLFLCVFDQLQNAFFQGANVVEPGQICANHVGLTAHGAYFPVHVLKNFVPSAYQHDLRTSEAKSMSEGASDPFARSSNNRKTAIQAE
jgi:hypothetical protein